MLMRSILSKFRNKKGQGLVEYALIILVLVAVFAVAAQPLYNTIKNAFVKASTAVNGASVTAP